MKSLVVKRGVTVALNSLPPYSIALDGYVQGPEIDLENQRFSFDHHDKCIRLVTRATCQQVMDALLLGLDPTEFTAYINDVDADTVMAVWLLMNPEALKEEGMRHLVEVVGAIDSHGPAYKTLGDEESRAFHSVVMAPEKRARRDKSYQTCDLVALLTECLENLDRVAQEGLELENDPEPAQYEITHRGTSGWIMATGPGFLFSTLYDHGYTKAIAYTRIQDGSYMYTVAKKSELVLNFPVGPASNERSILGVLYRTEPGWGGGSTIGGSPRNEDGSASKLTPDQVFAIVEALLKG
ncbi:MAG: hypothetical protein Q8P59_08875 [Dehalococcoidia bacterium]|nr:hypothetical protein [Dehalococcoidia bacterium]